MIKMHDTSTIGIRPMVEVSCISCTFLILLKNEKKSKKWNSSFQSKKRIPFHCFSTFFYKIFNL